MNDSEFQQRVVAHLQPHAVALTDALRRLVQHAYPTEVRSLEFEVFPDGFTSGWPVRAFFMDGDRSEVFVFENGNAESPSPIDPGLLDLDRVYDRALEETFEESCPDSDSYTLAGEALVPWFADCWRDAGGLEFGLGATIALHDDIRAFDLRRREWVDA